MYKNFLERIYREVLSTHILDSIKGNILGVLVESDIDHLDYILHLDQSKYVGKYSLIFNKLFDKWMTTPTQGLPFGKSDNKWIELTSTDLTPEELTVLKEHKSRQHVILKNIFENIVNITPLDNILIGKNSLYQYYEKNIYGNIINYDDEICYINTGEIIGNQVDIKLIKQYTLSNLIMLIALNSHQLNLLPKDQIGNIKSKYNKEIIMYKFYLNYRISI